MLKKPVDTLQEVCRGELRICPESREVWMGKHLLELTRYEFELLCLLARNPGRVFSKEQIYAYVWREDIGTADNAVQCVISSLRRKLKKYTDKEYIQTVWGIGYNFKSRRRECVRKAE